MLGQRVDRLLSHGQRLLAGSRRKVLEEMRRQDRYLLAALTKRRNVYTNNIKPVEKVLSKTPVFNGPFQIGVRGRKDPDIHSKRLGFSERLNLALFEESHQLWLHLQ